MGQVNMDREISNQELLALEQSLKAKLGPVVPDAGFIGNLQRRLEESPLMQRQRKLATSLLMTASGLLVGVVIFLIGRKYLHGESNS